jgi:hypothetical protein
MMDSMTLLKSSSPRLLASPATVTLVSDKLLLIADLSFDQYFTFLLDLRCYNYRMTNFKTLSLSISSRGFYCPSQKVFYCFSVRASVIYNLESMTVAMGFIYFSFIC